MARSTNDDTQRAIGALQAEVENLKRQIAEDVAERRALKTSVDDLRETISNLKFGWRLLLGLSLAVQAVIAIVLKALALYFQR